VSLNIVIYGHEQCPFCVKAKERAARLPNATISYVNVREAGMTKEDLSAACGRPVATVPQIIVDGEYVGGYQAFVERFAE